jgi:hypothetical protein
MGMLNKVKISLIVLAIIFFHLSCKSFQLGENYQLGIASEPREKSNALGSFFTFDNEIVEGTLSFFPEMYPANERISSLGFGLDLTYKLPFYLSKNIGIFPMFGIDSRYINITSNTGDDSPKNFGIGIKLGGGIDINIFPALFIRGEAFYQPEFTSFMNSYSGLRFNIGLGYRTKADLSRTSYHSSVFSSIDYDYYGYKSNKSKNELGWQWGKENIIIRDYLGSSKDIVIPSNINGHHVRRIYRGAFASKGLTSVVIGNIDYVGAGAFANNQIPNVIIGEGINVLAANAFHNNPLNSFTIENDVEIIFASDNFKTHSSMGFVLYASSGARAGTYIFTEGRWQYNGAILEVPALISSEVNSHDIRIDENIRINKDGRYVPSSSIIVPGNHTVSVYNQGRLPEYRTYTVNEGNYWVTYREVISGGTTPRTIATITHNFEQGKSYIITSENNRYVIKEVE